MEVQELTDPVRRDRCDIVTSEESSQPITGEIDVPIVAPPTQLPLVPCRIDLLSIKPPFRDEVEATHPEVAVSGNPTRLLDDLAVGPIALGDAFSRLLVRGAGA